MSISILLNYSLPVVGIELCLVWLVVRLFLEPYFMPRIFHKSWPTMDVGAQRSLTNHVVSFGLKVICCIGAYSIWETFVRNRPFDTPLYKDQDAFQQMTNGDILAFCYLTVPTIYLFELVYRTKISVVSAVHHIAAITINILGLIVVTSENQTGFLAMTEFKLILIYGTFEMIFEIFPHLAVMLYRIMRDRPRFLHNVFFWTAIGIFSGTFFEQFAIILFYVRIWRHVPVFYKASGPILHVCFMAAQIHGGRVCMQIAHKMKLEVMELTKAAAIAAVPMMEERGVGVGVGVGSADVDLEVGRASIGDAPSESDADTELTRTNTRPHTPPIPEVLVATEEPHPSVPSAPVVLH
ncbi:hypothetical protein JAAARDRAFT_192228 [Jaapia argillacea MUCL 33604]|uniref:TLC domain-containing protein n=1 Tax=Jaapia argillacea MUCL 33604 TaxID=933084 RepID=A0A067PY67_9AGAM|nr:hypothetical protein JAAARDRAFT_192228 [Jaapia argillacea MUCL 33604]